MTLKVVPIDGEPTVPTTARSSPSGWGGAVGLLLAVLVLGGCDGGTDARIRRAYELGRRPTEPNKARIEGMFRDGDRDVRATVLVVMESIDPGRASRLALIGIDDRDGFVRRASVKILAAGNVSDPELMRRLTTQAAGDPSWHVRREALDAIAPVDDPVVAEAFARALSDPVRHVRRTALRAGAARPGLLPIDRVSGMLADDPDWENRAEAARALGASRDPTAYAGLDQAMRDPNEFVRATAAAERRRLAREGVQEPAPPRAEENPGSGV